MEQAAAAMKQIHGKLTPEKVDETMYVYEKELSLFMSTIITCITNVSDNREKLREQNALGDEIAEAMTTTDLANQIDQDDLEAELDELQQESIDEQMLKLSDASIPKGMQNPPVSTIEQCMYCSFYYSASTESNISCANHYIYSCQHAISPGRRY